MTDPNMRVWDTDNLFVCSNAALPAIGAANLTLSMVAAVMKSISTLFS